MNLSNVIELYSESKEWELKGFEAFVKIFGEVVWQPEILQKCIYGSWGSYSSLNKFSRADKNYLMKLVLSIPDFKNVESVMRAVNNDIDENTYNYINANYKLSNPSWYILQSKFERIKKDRAHMKMKELEVEKSQILKELEELKNKRNVDPDTDVEESEHIQKKVAANVD